VIRIFECETRETEKERGWVFGGEKFDRERLGREWADPGEYKEK
jgi:hypothetical protein